MGLAASVATVFGLILIVLMIGACLSLSAVQRRAIQRVMIEFPKVPMYFDDPIRALGDDISLHSLEDVELM